MNNEQYQYDNGFIPTTAVGYNVQWYDNLVSGYLGGIALYGQSANSDYRDVYFYNNIFVDCQYGIAEYLNNNEVRPGGIEIKNN